MDLLNIKDNYLTKEEFKTITGINLDLELPSDDDEANKSDRFIHNTQNFILGILGSYDSQEINDHNKTFFKLALAEQVKYALVYTNDNLSLMAKQYLRSGGFMNIRRY